jgi:PHD/YefM family antitoxin component YafN of YafNO toxin-antitoxin module
MMSVTEILQNVQFVVDAAGNKKAVLLDYSLWEELLTQLEDLEDAEEIRHLCEAREEVISWEQAKGELRAEGVDV